MNICGPKNGCYIKVRLYHYIITKLCSTVLTIKILPFSLWSPFFSITKIKDKLSYAINHSICHLDYQIINKIIVQKKITKTLIKSVSCETWKIEKTYNSLWFKFTKCLRDKNLYFINLVNMLIQKRLWNPFFFTQSHRKCS